jgi:hypothetical protein
MKYKTFFFLAYSTLSVCFASDSDFKEYYNIVEQSIKIHSELKIIAEDPCWELPKVAETAIAKWEKRKNITSGYHYYDIKKEGYTPEDNLAIEKGSKYCTSHYNYWIARQKDILTLKEKMKWLQEIEEIFELATPILNEKYFPEFCEKETDYTLIFIQTKISDTKKIWFKKLLDLKKSLFRSLKKESSDLTYEESGQILGAFYTGLWSFSRKVSRVYNEGVICDEGSDFPTYLKTFEDFCSPYKDFLRPKNGIQPKLIFQIKFPYFMENILKSSPFYSNESKRELLIQLVSIVDEFNKK